MVWIERMVDRRKHRQFIPISETALLSRTSIASDTQKLIQLFVDTISISNGGDCDNPFMLFKKNCWDVLNFRTMHFVSVVREARQLFMHELFAHLEKYIYADIGGNDDESVPWNRIGALYGLYLLFFTQPTSPRIGNKEFITVPMVYCNRLANFINSPNLPADAQLILQKLRSSHAFQVVAYDETVEELVQYMETFDSSGAFPVVPRDITSQRASDRLQSLEQDIITQWMSESNASLLNSIGNMHKSSAMKEYRMARMDFEEVNTDRNVILNSEVLSQCVGSSSGNRVISELHENFYKAFNNYNLCLETTQLDMEENVAEEDEEDCVGEFEEVLDGDDDFYFNAFEEMLGVYLQSVE